MGQYENLIKALRSASTVSTAWEKLMTDAAAAIEELDAEETRLLLITSELQDKVVELEEELNDVDIAADAAAAIEELQQIADHYEQTAKDYWKEACEYKAQLPKRGEWIDRYDEDDKPFFKRKYVCSACGGWNTYGKSKYCPKCGAKMEVQE